MEDFLFLRNYSYNPNASKPPRIVIEPAAGTPASERVLQVTDIVYLKPSDNELPKYTLEYLLNGYNIVTLCDPTDDTVRNWEGIDYQNGDVYKTIHLMGAVLVRGDLSGNTAFADSAVITVPSYVGTVNGGGAITGALANTRNDNNNPPALIMGEDNAVMGQYLNKSTVLV